MAESTEGAHDRLWREYCQVFRTFDDMTLARWMAQTLGQIEGRVWRYSHPLIGCYRMAAQTAHERGFGLKRLATAPPAYVEAPCCRAPLLPFFSRDVGESGLLCLHCFETAVAVDELPEPLKAALVPWAKKYHLIHEVAHWDDAKRKKVRNYDDEFQKAAEAAEDLQELAARTILPAFLDYYPAVVWEDSDECLDIRPDDLITPATPK
jgi:hypothetical protein